MKTGEHSQGWSVLKGRGFSRAKHRLGSWGSALAAAGMRAFHDQLPRGLKPGIDLRCLAARLKPRPFKALHPATARTLSHALAFALFSTCLCAQQRSPSAQDSAHELAQRVDRHYNQLHSLKAAFTESYEGLGFSAPRAARCCWSPAMRWDYASPPGKLFLLDGKYAWL